MRNIKSDHSTAISSYHALRNKAVATPYTNLKTYALIIILVVFSCIQLWPVKSFCQNSTDILRTNDSIVIAAGEIYKAGGLKKFIIGAHYRDEWILPIKIPILDLQNSGGGLIPLKKSGGMQSKSLSFKTAQGDRFMFRSINKDPTKILPPELQRTIVADALQDGISTAHPYGSIVVPILADAA